MRKHNPGLVTSDVLTEFHVLLLQTAEQHTSETLAQESRFTKADRHSCPYHGSREEGGGGGGGLRGPLPLHHPMLFEYETMKTLRQT